MEVGDGLSSCKTWEGLGSSARDLVSRLILGNMMMAAERTAKTIRIGMTAIRVCSVDRLVMNLNMTELN
jgi:hypothetical protein